MHRFERATKDMSREEILERLEGVSPAGSGAADGCAGREAGGQPADVEARSVESRAVAPGKARPKSASATMAVLRGLCENAREAESLTDAELKSAIQTEIMGEMNFGSREEALMEEALERWMGEPDSDADEPKPDIILEIGEMPESDDEPQNQRSGRRNVKADTSK